MAQALESTCPLPFEQIRVEPLTPAIGATVSNVTLSGDCAPAVISEIRQALLQHLVLFFHDQEISPKEHRDFGALFGDLEVHPYLPALSDCPEMVVLENDEKRPPEVNFWHSDVTFAEKPPMGAILLAREVPAVGGDTLWASMYAAYEALSDKLQHLLSGLTAVHIGNVARYEQAYGRVADGDPAKAPSAEHPIVRTHPETGRKGLFVHAASTNHIVGMSDLESRELLNLLYRHAQAPEFQIRYHWRRNSVAFWDNRCTQHYAAADYWPMRRLMHRLSIQGERPV